MLSNHKHRKRNETSMSAKLLVQPENSSMFQRDFELAVLAGLLSAQKEVKLNQVTELRDCVTYTVPGNKNRKNSWISAFHTRCKYSHALYKVMSLMLE